MNSKSHWSNIYQTKTTTDVSWYQARPTLSLDLITATGIAKSGRIIDVGGGASTLVDHLLDDGYRDVTVLDISGEALGAAQQRLGERAAAVTWIEGDITTVDLPEHGYDLWHDRAVFHFLTQQQQQQRYVAQARAAVKPGRHVIVATFAADGPEQCSGLTVARYDASALHGAFGDGFDLISSRAETHTTPWGSAQKFTYCYCRTADDR
jgi:SAM-dependent methyltransferase